jgi:hypothetical protein
MSNMIQLSPSIPVHVLNRGAGEAVGWIDYGKEDHLIWVVAMDSNGEVWCVPNPEIRFMPNYSIGRRYVVKKEKEESKVNSESSSDQVGKP